MCGKFAAPSSWQQVTAFEDPLTVTVPAFDEQDKLTVYRVMTALPVVVSDARASKRVVVPMRWGFPDARNPRVPRPIHARGETIDATPAFAAAFKQGQGGTVLAKTFNEGRELKNGKTEQHTITPGPLGAVGLAFVWRRFSSPALPAPMFACVMVTVGPMH